MSTSVDMSLDDIIKRQKNGERTRGRGRGFRGRGYGRSFIGGRMNRMGPRGPLAVNARPSSYAIAKSASRRRSFPWQTDLFEDSIRAAGIQGIEIGTKLYVSNLDRGVTNDDIRELFSEIGDVKRYAIHYDKTGRPSGSAEVVYTRRSDAFSAHKRYNNVLLDGKPMKIEIVGANSEIPFSAQINVTGFNGRKKRTVVMYAVTSTLHCCTIVSGLLCHNDLLMDSLLMLLRPGQGTARGPVIPNHGTGLVILVRILFSQLISNRKTRKLNLIG
ncbi:hypothetical protein SAY87_019710 [Trapa incisa]|uniref:RRM domain-containing protein n=1 Tax=Trapa incisa TaxID=236973 RepID=A0AAN7K2Q3_9MYRT|nr:hypothetical protein SAY87_019710 [Trapa incisa]